MLSYSRTSNATGVNLFTQAVEGKKLELLAKLVPTVVTVAFFTNPNNPTVSEGKIKEMQEAARSLGRQLQVLNASTAADFGPAFATLVQQRAGLLVVGADPFFDETGRNQIIALAADHQVPRFTRSARPRRRWTNELRNQSCRRG